MDEFVMDATPGTANAHGAAFRAPFRAPSEAPTDDVSSGGVGASSIGFGIATGEVPSADPQLFPADGPSLFAPREAAAPPSGPVGEGPAIAGLASAVKSALRSKLAPEQFQTWFERSALVRIDDAAATIAVPNSFAKDWIERYYGDALSECIVGVLGTHRRVAIVERPEAFASDVPPSGSIALDPPRNVAGIHPGASSFPHHSPHSSPPVHGGGNPTPTPVHPSTVADQAPRLDAPVRAGSSRTGSAAPRPTKRVALEESSDFALNSSCTFDTFVVGPCNRFGHAAAMGAAEQPGTAYNPLFLHGSVGVGKTHLLQAFCFSVLERQPESRILYLSCETFVNHFIAALENGDTQSFRDKYRNIDVLVVDDIQILANKEKTQEEFFHTFNTLYNSGKQIVLSSDSPPKDIPTLQDRLVSRFKWGMVTEIEAPCFETRMAIVKRKAKDRNAEIPGNVAKFIAESIEVNVRELEGAVTRVIGYARVNGKEITLDGAREALAGLIEVRKGAPTVDDIISLVTAHYQIKLSDLQSKRRTKALAFARQVAMYLIRKVTRHSLEEIGGFFGGRDHTTVLYAVDKIEKLIHEDQEFSERVHGFMERLT